MDAFLSESLVAFNYDIGKNKFLNSNNSSYNNNANNKRLSMKSIKKSSSSLSASKRKYFFPKQFESQKSEADGREMEAHECVNIPLKIKNRMPAEMPTYSRSNLNKAKSISTLTPRLSDCSTSSQSSCSSSLVSITTTTIMARSRASPVGSNMSKSDYSVKLIPLESNKSPRSNQMQNENFQLISTNVHEKKSPREMIKDGIRPPTSTILPPASLAHCSMTSSLPQCAQQHQVCAATCSSSLSYSSSSSSSISSPKIYKLDSFLKNNVSSFFPTSFEFINSTTKKLNH